MAKWCVAIDDQPFACGDERQMQADARELRRLRDMGDPEFAGKRIEVRNMLTTPPKPRGDRGRRNVKAKGIADVDAIDTKRAAGTGLLAVLGALAGGAAAYGVWKYAQGDLERRLGGDAQALRRELRARGGDIEEVAQAAARAAAERQVWATLSSFGLSQDRIRAIQQVVQRAESTLGLRGPGLGAAPPPPPPPARTAAPAPAPAATPPPPKKTNGGTGWPEGGGEGDDGGYLN